METLPRFPETRTVSTRLNWNDYTLLRGIAKATGRTTHAIIRLLIAAWINRVADDLGVPCPMSRSMKAALRIDRARAENNVIPDDWC